MGWIPVLRRHVRQRRGSADKSHSAIRGRLLFAQLAGSDPMLALWRRENSWDLIRVAENLSLLYAHRIIFEHEMPRAHFVEVMALAANQ